MESQSPQLPFIVEQVERNLLCLYGKNGSG